MYIFLNTGTYQVDITKYKKTTLNKGVLMNMKTLNKGYNKITKIDADVDANSIFWYVFYAFLHPRRGQIATAVCFCVESYA